jgi:hypothetical protein
VPVANPCHDPGLALQCPDLVMGAPTDLKIDRTPSARVLLRMENAIINIGQGPAELFGRRTGPREMTASQVIPDAAGVRRRFATGAEVYYTSVPARGGDYWKMDDAARFELFAMQPAGRRGALVKVGPKLRYCLRDLDRVRGWQRVPPRRVFGACNQSASKQEVTLGTSVGWADVYPAAYPGNWIEVTGLRGCFVVLHRADPERHILEISEANNISAKTVRLPFRAGPQRCPGYRA